MGNGGIDLHRLEGLDALLDLALVGHRAHVVQTVRHLDEDDADILCHGEQHLAQVFHLLLLDAGILHARQLRDALDDVRDGGAEVAGNVLVREARVLDAVVQERGDDGVLVKAHLRRDDRRGNAVGDVGRAVLALLPRVGAVGQLKGRAHAPQLHREIGGGDGLFQLGVVLLQIILFFLFFHIGFL